MDPHLQTVVDHIADEADELLSDANGRAQARALIGGLLESDYAEISASDRAKVVAAVMAILEREEFFSGPVGGTAAVEDETDAE